MNDSSYPQIAMVTACHNHGAYVAETIESVLNQRYPNLQYVVIDDGSTDNSWEVISRYRDRLFHCERMEGYRKYPTYALNHGFSLTDGAILGWINSDDILLPKSLFAVAEAIRENPDVEWLTGITTTMRQDSLLMSSRLNLRSKYDYLCGDMGIIQQESTFFTRNLWQRAGGCLRDGWAFDIELWTRFFLLTEHVHLGMPVGAFRKGAQSKCVTEPDMFADWAKRYIEIMRQNVPPSLRREARQYWLLKRMWPLVGLLPDRVVRRVPGLRAYCYRVLNYNPSARRWVTRWKSPFRYVFNQNEHAPRWD